jgi:cathepsin A (carboxypeptidase C)
MKWSCFLGFAGPVLGAFVSSPLEREPSVSFHTRSFEYRNETVEATLKVQSPSGLCDPSVKQHSGYFTFGKDKKQYFFWMFESRNDPANDPTVMWLTGGPGCSSMTGLLFENGPCKVSADGKSTVPNPYSWTTKANVMWVDQPPGTGFSKGAFDFGEDGVAEDMYQFLQVFFKAKPGYNKNFFVTGESYAGHYIPAVTHRIFDGNSKLQEGDIKIDLKGMGIGNGMTDPQEQYKWYPDYMCTGGGVARPVINSSVECAALKAADVVCETTLKGCNSGVPVVAKAACGAAMKTCALAFQVPYMATGLNPYDVRIKCDKPPLCYDMTNDVDFLNDPEVQKQLGVNMKFESCNMIVNKGFTLDFMKNYHMLIPPMLAGGIDVLIYAGDQDFICNWLGNEKWVQALEWQHKAEFNAAAKKPYVVSGKDVGAKDGKEVGQLQSFANLHFLRVYQAGHMVPMNQPEAALGMLNDLLAGKFLNPVSEVIV